RERREKSVSSYFFALFSPWRLCGDRSQGFASKLQHASRRKPNFNTCALQHLRTSTLACFNTLAAAPRLLVIRMLSKPHNTILSVDADTNRSPFDLLPHSGVDDQRVV